MQYNIVKYYYTFLFLKVFNFCNGKAEASVSHEPSQIILICWFGAQETFLLINNAEINYIFCGNPAKRTGYLK